MKVPCLKLFSIALTFAFFSAQTRLSAAPVLKITEKGVMIENDAMKCSLAFPVPINTAKVKAKVLEKTVSETGVTLKYEEGGQIDLEILDGEIGLKFSGMPTDTQFVYFTAEVDATVAGNGKWQLDSKSGVFPLQLAGVNITQATAKSLSVAPPSGAGVAFSLPAPAFQQLQDLRQFQRPKFYWQCWMPFAAGTEKLSIKISEVAGEAGAPTANASVAQVPAPVATPTPAPKPAPTSVERQGWGQLSRSPEGKKTGTRILKLKDGKQAAYLLGFDDNYGTMFTNVIPELEKHKMVGNFYVNPGSDKWKQHKAEWEAAAKSPYVVLHNHTFLHLGVQSVAELEADLLKTNEAIYAITPQLKNPRMLCFRAPGGCPWKVTKEEMQAVLAKHHLTSRPWIDGPPLTMKSLDPLLGTVDNALAKGEVGFVDFHGVGAEGSLTAPVEWFVALLDKLDSQRANLWITDSVSLTQYQVERNKSELKVLQSDASQVRASLTCSCDPAYFDMPLTIAIEVPAAWTKCKVTQGAKTWQAIAAGGELRCDALPGTDEIVIKPQ